MKIKLKQLKPNPFKKEINKGELNKNQLEKIKSNIEELGLMGSIPVVKRDKNYYLVSHHHRVAALKEVYGEDFEVDVTLHNYDDDQLLRGMIIENITQRDNEFEEESQNILAIRKWLQSACPPGGHANIQKGKKDFQDVPGSSRDIANWLNKNGEVISKSKIADILRINDQLDPKLLEKVRKVSSGGDKDEDDVTIKQAVALSRFDKKEQEDLLNAMRTSSHGRAHELIPLYSKLKDKETKNLVRSGKLKLEDLQNEALIESAKIRDKISKVGTLDNPEILIPTINEVMVKLKSEWGQLHSRIIQTKKIANSFRKEQLYGAFSERQKSEMSNFLVEVEKEVKEFLDIVVEMNNSMIKAEKVINYVQ